MAVPQGWFWATDPNGTSLPGGWRYGKDGKPFASDPGGSAHPAGVWAQHGGSWDYREGGAAKPAPGGLAPQRVTPAGWKPPAPASGTQASGTQASGTQAAVSSPTAAVQAITTPAPAKPAPLAPAPAPAAPTSNAGNWQAGFNAKGDLAPGATAVAKAGGGTIENNITAVTGGNAGSGHLDQVLSGVAPAPRSEAELAEARRAAFLGASDSMAGIRAVRGILADEVKRRGGTPTAEPQATVKGLEAQIASAQVAPGITYGKGGQWETTNDKAGEQATLDAMSFERHPFVPGTQVDSSGVAQSPAAPTVGDQAMVGFGIRDQVLAPSGNLPQATVNNYLSSDTFKGKLRASNQPLNEIAKWQLGTQPIAAPREDAGRDATLAAFAAQGAVRPAGAGEAVLAAMAGNAAGTRGGQFKPGNTVMLPQLDPTKLPPRGIGGFVSSPSAWGYG